MAVSAVISVRGETVSRCHEALLSPKDLNSLSELAEALKNDPFAEAFGIFVADIEETRESFRKIDESWSSYLRTKCRPHNSEVDHFETAANQWSSSHCATGPLMKEEVYGCQVELSRLQQWKTRLTDEYSEYRAEEEELLRELQDVDSRSKNRILNAQNLLNPDYVEDAFRLYTWYIIHRKEAGELNSCQAFALLADKLGARVANQGYFVDYLTRSLIETVGRNGRLVHIIIGNPPFKPTAGSTFDATGFRPKFVDTISDNQVRHTAGYIAIGYKMGPSSAEFNTFIQDIALKYVHREKPEMGDYYLAISAAQLGFRLKHGRLRAGNFGDAFRGEVCR
jgi:hypothetical protein